MTLWGGIILLVQPLRRPGEGGAISLPPSRPWTRHPSRFPHRVIPAHAGTSVALVGRRRPALPRLSLL